MLLIKRSPISLIISSSHVLFFTDADFRLKYIEHLKQTLGLSLGGRFNFSQGVLLPIIPNGGRRLPVNPACHNYLINWKIS